MRLIVIKILLLLIIVISCSAPRNNPLDPENPDNNLSNIEGIVRTIKVPQIPIPDAKVTWEAEGRIVFTNENGYFNFENVKRNSGTLIIEKSNYGTDSLFIEFNNQNKISKNIFLNATPQINELLFYSITVNKFPSRQSYSLGISVNLTDAENDIDSVFIENEELNISKELIYNISSGNYEGSIKLEDLNVTSIDIVIGKEFSLIVFDSNGKRLEVDQTLIKRIIKEEVEPISPIGRDTVFVPNPLLKWNRFTPGFEFRYLLQIKTQEADPTLSWQKEITSEAIEFQTDAQLIPGEYFWVIWAIDEFENRTQSKPSSFIIN